MSLEELLAADECPTISRGCGFTKASLHNGTTGIERWYAGWGEPPVALSFSSDTGSDAPPIALVALRACGRFEVSTGGFSGARYSFDLASGALVGAVAFRPGPFAAPCGTERVFAGAAVIGPTGEGRGTTTPSVAPTARPEP